ncbi:MAG: helix-turn-helix domain-containing protein [Terracidiphilus sp.]|jgi:transcriptional regulator with XRE-family HTH domain
MEWKMQMIAQRELDRKLRSYLMARRVHRPSGGWLRAVRKAQGLTARGIAEDLRVSPSAVFRMERAEWKDKISLQGLDKAARAMSCKLVYAIVPYKGSFEEHAAKDVKRLVERQKSERKQKQKLAVAMAGVKKTWEQKKEGTEVANRRIRKLVEALWEKMKEEVAAGKG